MHILEILWILWGLFFFLSEYPSEEEEVASCLGLYQILFWGNSDWPVKGEIARLQGSSRWIDRPVACYRDSKIWMTTGKLENELLRQLNWPAQSECWKTGVWVRFLAESGDFYLYHGVQTGSRAHPLSVQLLLYTWVKRPELDPKFFPVSSVEVQEIP